MYATSAMQVLKEWNRCVITLENSIHIVKEYDRRRKKKSYTALSCFTIGGRAFRKTLKPQIHLISGSRESSSTVTRVPQRMHSYATELSPEEASNYLLLHFLKGSPTF
ncbi:MAG: hypothetical protein M3261_00470 [Thermoproteota archaeon]|nr:hypothetical protein [Thermoproteota archaeon]